MDQGVFWFDDFYFDVVVLKDGEVFLLDEDEFEDVFLCKYIIIGDYDLVN